MQKEVLILYLTQICYFTVVFQCLKTGAFKKVNIMGKTLSGREYFNFIEQAAHKAYFER